MSIACPLIRLSISHASHVATGKSTRPRGARHDLLDDCKMADQFQSTRPCGARLPMDFTKPELCKFQSTRPRGARLSHTAGGRCPGAVSIHAPAWGATCRRQRLQQVQVVSIHAPAWGATWLLSRLDELRGVSIHAPAWGATDWPVRLAQDGGVSIHAPAWGATTRQCLTLGHLWFQSTRPRGARHSEARLFDAAGKFQSTRPRGARPPGRGWRCPAPRFNPRARVGRDPAAEDHLAHLDLVSIHAPAWGAT